VIAYDNASAYLLALNRFDEARQIYDQAIARKLDDDVLHLNRYAIAFFEPDPKAMSEQAAWFTDKPEVENEMHSFRLVGFGSCRSAAYNLLSPKIDNSYFISADSGERVQFLESVAYLVRTAFPEVRAIGQDLKNVVDVIHGRPLLTAASGIIVLPAQNLSRCLYHLISKRGERSPIAV
jgi:hypothetical protein